MNLAPVEEATAKGFLAGLLSYPPDKNPWLRHDGSSGTLGRAWEAGRKLAESLHRVAHRQDGA